MIMELIEIDPIHEVPPEGGTRESDATETLTDGKRIMVTMDDNVYKHFFHPTLMKATYLDENDPEPIFSEDVIHLMEKIDMYLKEEYRYVFVIKKSNVLNMFSIHCDKFKYPLSIKMEYRGKYSIRTGTHWNDPFYYGSSIHNVSHTYKECSSEEIFEAIEFIIRKKIYSNPRYKDRRPYNDKPPITEEECVEFCKEFIRNEFKLFRTFKLCKNMGMNITYNYARKIVTKQRFRNISDLYFVYNGHGYNSIDSFMFEPIWFGEEYEVK